MSVAHGLGCSPMMHHGPEALPANRMYTRRDSNPQSHPKEEIAGSSPASSSGGGEAEVQHREGSKQAQVIADVHSLATALS